MNNELLQNLDKLHTTPMGVARIRRNLGLGDDIPDVVVWCKKQIEYDHVFPDILSFLAILFCHYPFLSIV